MSAAVGPETEVNTTTAGSQQMPAVAALKSGYVVVWASNGQDGSGYGIYAQRFTAAGAKRAARLARQHHDDGRQTSPAVAGLSDGGFVVVWQSNGEDGSGFGIYGQRFTAAGAKVGTEFKVNTTTAGNQTQPAVAALAGGGFVVTWTSSGQDGSGLGVYAQRYDATGKAQGSEFLVNKTTAGDQSMPSIAGLTGGGFVVAWQSSAQDRLRPRRLCAALRCDRQGAQRRVQGQRGDGARSVAAVDRRARQWRLRRCFPVCLAGRLRARRLHAALHGDGRAEPAARRASTPRP